MPNESSDDNKAYCKDYYQRLKQDPVKWKAFLEKRACYKKSRRPVNPAAHCEPRQPEPVNPCEPTRPKLVLDNSANSSPQLPFETTAELAERRNYEWYEANKEALKKLGLG